MAITIESRAITTISSISVKAPRRRGLTLLFSLVPARDVIIATHASIGSHGHDVVRACIVFPRTIVNISLSPRVIGNALLLEVRAAPIGRVLGLGDEIVQAALALGIIPVVHFKGVERGLEIGN